MSFYEEDENVYWQRGLMKLQYQEGACQIFLPSTNVLVPEQVTRVKLNYLLYAELWQIQKHRHYTLVLPLVRFLGKQIVRWRFAQS